MNLMRIAGALLLLALVAWIGIAVIAPIGAHQSPEVLGLGSAFEGNLQLPAEKISAEFDHARTRMLEVNSTGAQLRMAGDVSGWLSFAATAAITLIVGFFGRTPAAAGAAPNTGGLPARSVRLIGFLAALAAILTAFGSLALEKSQEYFKHADELRDLIVRERAQEIDAKTAEAAQAILDDLVIKTSR